MVRGTKVSKILPPASHAFLPVAAGFVGAEAGAFAGAAAAGAFAGAAAAGFASDADFAWPADTTGTGADGFKGAAEDFASTVDLPCPPGAVGTGAGF